MTSYKLKSVSYEEYVRPFSPFALAGINDVYFGRRGVTVVKSYDSGRTYEDWFTPNDNELTLLAMVTAVQENKVIAGYNSSNPDKQGYYLVEIGEQTTFRFLGKMNADWPSIGFGIDRYPRQGNADKLVFLAEYALKEVPNYGRHLYVYDESKDEFRTIFELPLQVSLQTHLHGPHYDWRTDTVWVCNGDFHRSANLWYSKNWRNATPTWNKVWNTGTAPVQFTSIYSTEDQILLGSDGVGNDGLFAINKNAENNYFNPTLITLFHIKDIEAGVPPLVGRTFHETSTGEIYLSFSSKIDFPSLLLGSKDLKNWYVIVSTTESDLAVVDMVSDHLILMYDVNSRNRFRLLDIEWEAIPDRETTYPKTTLNKGVLVFNLNGQIVRGELVSGIIDVENGTVIY